jgi:hypothetical protein
MGAVAPARSPRTAPRRPSRPGRGTTPRRAPKPRRSAASRAITPPAGLIPAAVGRVGDIADSGLMQRMTRSRAWIGVLGLLLAGIVTVNVLSLSYTASGGKTAARSEALRLENAKLRSDLTKRLSGQRVEAVAASLGLAVPAARDIQYLSAGDQYAKVAARRIEQGLLTSGAVAPAPVEPAVAPVEPAPVEPVAEPAVPAVAPEPVPAPPAPVAP